MRKRACSAPLNYDPDIGPEQVFEEHRAWGGKVAAASGPPLRHAIAGSASRRLRIGYVSPDLKHHPVTYLFAPVLAHHDHGELEIVCYDNLAQPDHVTARLTRLSDRWRDVAGLSDEAFCEQVRADGIDILVDLAGHTTGGRLRAFARKPAPVQVSWLGCFNNASKINDRVIALWSRVLKRVPGSRLRLKSIGLHDAANVEHARGRFAKHGVQDERLELQPYVAHPELLAAFGDIDIALDPFPFCGGMTSLESLWMGVPVVTLEQPMLAGRQTSSMLRNLGLEALVAADEQSYADIAASLASDFVALAEMRAELRPRMTASPLLDAARFTRNLEDDYRQVWSEAVNAAQSKRP